MIFSSPANVPLLSPSSSQMNLFQRLLDIRICFSLNRIMPSSSTPLTWPCIARTRRFHRAKFPLATKSVAGFRQIVAEPSPAIGHPTD